MNNEDETQAQQDSIQRKVDAIVESKPLQAQHIQAGGKATNVIMQNQQAVMMEYTSEPFIPQEVIDARPIESMMIMKRAIGFETEFDIASNDIEYEMVTCVRVIAGEEVALDLALAYIHHREGLRAKGGAERNAQVVQKTVEELRTFNQNQKGSGVWARIGSFVGGPKPGQPQAPQ